MFPVDNRRGVSRWVVSRKLVTKPREVLKSADTITLAILFVTVTCGYVLLLLPPPQDLERACTALHERPC